VIGQEWIGPDYRLGKLEPQMIFVSRHFYPDLNGIGKYATEYVKWWSETLDEPVHIIVPNSEAFTRTSALSNIFTLFSISRRQTRNKILEEATELAFGLLIVGRLLFSKTFYAERTIFLVSPPAIFGLPLLILARLCGKRTVYLIQDLESSLVALFPAFKLLSKLVGKLESLCVACATRVIVINPDMKKSLPGIDGVCCIYNFADDFAFELKDLKSVSPEIIYSGNFGKKVDFSLIRQAVTILGLSVKWRLIGGGRSERRVRETFGRLKNVKIEPFLSEESFRQLLKDDHIHIIPQTRGISTAVLPSKIHNLFAAGARIVGTGDSGTFFESIMNSGGIFVPAGDVEYFCASLRIALEKYPDEKRKFAQRFAAENFSREKNLSALTTCVKGRDSGIGV